MTVGLTEHVNTSRCYQKYSLALEEVLEYLKVRMKYLSMD